MNWRKIVVNNEEYKYHIGESNVVIRKDEKKWACAGFNTLLNMDWFEIEKLSNKKSLRITPKDIANYIERKK